MEARKAASWFVEISGAIQGPLDSSQIKELIMNGTLRVESKIFDANANEWKIAADVVPYLDFDSESEPEQNKHSQLSSFTPPPKPTELKDYHVVDPNYEPTDQIDYFALIAERKKEALQKEIHRDKIPASKNAILGRFSKAPKQISETKTQSPSIIETVEASNASEKLGTLLERSLAFGLKWKNEFAIAASLAFIFIGSFSMIQKFSTDSTREPAAKQKAKAAAESKISRPPSFPVSSNVQQIHDSEGLGSGRNFSKRQSGGVANNPLRQMQPRQQGEQNQGDTGNNQPTSQDSGAQFISSREESPTEAQSQPEAQQPQQDPNQGTVSPPGFVPPQEPAQPQNEQPSDTPQVNPEG